MHSARSISLTVCAFALLVNAPPVVRAQTSDVTATPAQSCLATIPDSLLRSVAVYLQAELVDSANRAILSGIDLLAQDVADSVRASLGATADQLPNAEPTLNWRALDARLDVVLRRDGLVHSAVHLSDDGNRPDSAAALLLARALAAVAKNGQHFVIWPDGLESDSVAFRLEMHYPFVNGRGDVGTLDLRQAFALFAVRVPTSEPAVAKRLRHPAYADELQAKGVAGDLIMQFIVDTTGRAEMATVKDVWPSDRPRLTGEKGQYYEAFRKAVVRSLPGDRFEPARIGGCKVRQLVQMPFGFRLRQ
jgi:hypothetical protein